MFRERSVVISCSNIGIFPILRNSSSMHRTGIGSLPPCFISALSHSRLNICIYKKAARKLSVESVSLVITKSAVFSSPSLSSSSSSF